MNHAPISCLNIWTRFHSCFGWKKCILKIKRPSINTTPFSTRRAGRTVNVYRRAHKEKKKKPGAEGVVLMAIRIHFLSIFPIERKRWIHSFFSDFFFQWKDQLKKASTLSPSLQRAIRVWEKARACYCNDTSGTHLPSSSSFFYFSRGLFSCS